MRIGILTGGGDCPGLNAVIRAAVVKGSRAGHEFVGFRDGWRGPLDVDFRELTGDDVDGILVEGGTILGTSRTNPLSQDQGIERTQAGLREAGCDALIAIGGEDTLGVAASLYQAGTPVVGVPKTIDNDLSGTDFTFGFDTAVHIATEAIDRLRTTAQSHHRAMVVEVMGRHAGWIALHSGMASGAAVILIPERPYDIGAVCAHMEHRFAAGQAPIVVVSEGAVAAGGDVTVTGEKTDAFGHVQLGGAGERVAGQIEEQSGRQTRMVVLGHLQRGGTPTAFDRWLATRFGLHALDAVTGSDFGIMVALRGTDIARVSLAHATGELKLVDDEQLAEAEALFG